tara:strand:+ start:116420 stop:117298 length:879 start_codon:yes stop_codon:yes gene_type:complete
MSLLHTEMQSDHHAIDAVTAERGVALILDGQAAAVDATRRATADLAAGAALMADALRAGGSLIYAAAGSSGLMALSDGCELPGTFGVSARQIQIHMAGGVPADGVMPGDVEDDAEATKNIVIRSSDAVIVLSASGATPYALAVVARARAAGAKVIAIANNPGTPLLEMADVAIYLNTPAEVIAGSTRMAAGTAQKAALNVMSTLMGVQLGHVYHGLMVNLVADNAKLRQRANGIVRQISNVTSDEAATALVTAKGAVKLAILLAKGLPEDHAQALLDRHAGHLGPCLIDTPK